MRFSSKNRTDYLVVGASALIITACSVLLYADYARRADSGGARRIGTITFKKEVAQRKYQSQVIWEDLDRDAPVYNNDTIRTADLSEAVISLADGTKINMDENSLILLEMSGKGINIDFSSGSISADRADARDAGASQVSIRSQNAVVTLDRADVKLTRTGEKELDVTVTSGQAAVKTGTMEKTVQKDEKAIITGDAGARVTRLALKLLSPDHNGTVVTGALTVPVRFSWKAPQHAPVVFLDIARDGAFTRGVVTRQTPGDTFTEVLGEGSYYWRVRSPGGAGRPAEYSDVRKISVLRDRPVAIIQPVDNEVISYGDKPPIINFRWRENSLAAGYILELSGDPSFRSVVRAVQTGLMDISVDGLGAGTYYWRVRTTGDRVSSKGGTSAVSAFRIERTASVKAPSLISPPEGKRVSSSMFGRSGGYLFSWSPDAGSGRYEFIIGTDRELRNVTAQATVSVNYYALRQGLEPGTYFWRVAAVSGSGSGDSVSAARDLIVIPVGAVVTGEPRVTATAGTGPEDRRSSIRFPCSAVNFKGNRSVDLARDSAFLNGIASVATMEDSVIIGNIPPGAYFWRVRLYDDDRTQIGESEPRQVFISTSGEIVGSAAEIDTVKTARSVAREEKPRGERDDETAKEEKAGPAAIEKERREQKRREDIERRKEAGLARARQEEEAKKMREALSRKRQEELTADRGRERALAGGADIDRSRQEEVARKRRNALLRRRQKELAKGNEEQLARQRQEEIARKRAEDSARKRREEAARLKQEELARGNEKELARKREEEQARRNEANLARKRREEAARLKQEELARGKEKELARQRQEEIARKRAEDSARKRREEAAKLMQEEPAKKKQNELIAKKQEIPVKKEAKKDQASLEISSSARGSAIYANSRLMGYETAKVRPIPGQKLVITIKADGFSEYKQSLTLQSGEKKNINARMVPEKPVFREKRPGNRLRWKTNLVASVVSKPVYRNRTLVATTKNGFLVCLDMNGNQIWRTSLGSVARSTPAADDRAVYIVTVDGNLVSVDLRGGGVNWKKKIEGPLLYGSEPVLDGGRIFVATSYGMVQAFTRDGSEVWRQNLSEGIFSSMICDSGVLYVGTDRSRIYAISARDGGVKWTFQTDSRIFSSAPRVYRGILYAGCQSGTLYAIERDGSLRWQYRARKAVMAPVFFDDLVCFGSEDGMVYALDVDGGDKLWEFRTGSPIIAGPDIYRDSVLIPGGNAVFSIDVNSGELNWREVFESGVNTAVTVVGNTAYVGLNNGDVVSLVSL